MPSTGPVILSNRPTNVTFGTVTGSGAPGIPAAVMLDTMDDDVPLENAISKPRALPGANGSILMEPGAKVAGGGQSATGGIGRVNGILCTDGLPHYPLTCSATADPRGKGYAAIAD
jgi:gamma-glutamyltranspeptidase